MYISLYPTHVSHVKGDISKDNERLDVMYHGGSCTPFSPLSLSPRFENGGLSIHGDQIQHIKAVIQHAFMTCLVDCLTETHDFLTCM